MARQEAVVFSSSIICNGASSRDNDSPNGYAEGCGSCAGSRADGRPDRYAQGGGSCAGSRSNGRADRSAEGRYDDDSVAESEGNGAEARRWPRFGMGQLEF